jgi:hypothetical protein
MELASILTIVVFFSLIALFVFIVVNSEKNKIAEREHLAAKVGATFTMETATLGETPLVDIPLLQANPNSRALCLWSASKTDFDSYHFTFNLSRPTGATAEGGGSAFAAVFRLKNVSLPKFGLAPSGRIARAMASISSGTTETLELSNELLVTFDSACGNPRELEKLGILSPKYSCFPSGLFLKADGMWIYMQTSSKSIDWEDWFHETNDVVSQILRIRWMSIES